MSIYDSYNLSSENSRRQRVYDIDVQEQVMLDQVRALQGERAILLKTLGVTALVSLSNETAVPVFAETA